MLKWNYQIKSHVRYQAYQVAYACPLHEMTDLMQEGWIVFDRLVNSHTREHLIAHHGELDDAGCRAAWFQLFKVSLRNHFLNIVRAASRRVTLVGIEPESASLVSYVRGIDSQSAGHRAVEIACDLERAPGIRRILRTVSWEDGVARVRTPRRLKSGAMETRADVLQRLVGRRAVGDFDAQLALVV